MREGRWGQNFQFKANDLWKVWLSSTNQMYTWICDICRHGAYTVHWPKYILALFLHGGWISLLHMNATCLAAIDAVSVAVIVRLYTRCSKHNPVVSVKDIIRSHCDLRRALGRYGTVNFVEVRVWFSGSQLEKSPTDDHWRRAERQPACGTVWHRLTMNLPVSANFMNIS